MKTKDNDILIAIIIAIIVQIFYITIYYKPQMIITEMDLTWFGIGIILPYLLPITIYINKNKKTLEKGDEKNEKHNQGIHKKTVFSNR